MFHPMNTKCFFTKKSFLRRATDKMEEEMVTFTFAKGRNTVVQKSVLLGSEVFAAMLCGGFSESTSNSVHIPNIKRKCFNLLLALLKGDQEAVRKKCCFARVANSKAMKRSAQLLLAMRQYDVNTMASDLLAILQRNASQTNDLLGLGLIFEAAVAWEDDRLQKVVQGKVVRSVHDNMVYDVMRTEISMPCFNRYLLTHMQPQRFSKVLEVAIARSDSNFIENFVGGIENASGGTDQPEFFIAFCKSTQIFIGIKSIF